MDQKSVFLYSSLAFVLFGILFFSLFFGWHTIGLAETKAKCTVTLTSDQSIQKAVNKVQTSSVVCLEEGQWKEQVKINKPLTLRGSGRKTKIYTELPEAIFEYTIHIENANLVKLQDLHVSFSGRQGMPVVSIDTALKVNNCKFSDKKTIRSIGLGFTRNSKGKQLKTPNLEVSNSNFSGCGIKMTSAYSPVKAIIEGTTINDSEHCGLCIGNPGTPTRVYRGPKFEVTVNNSVISGNGKEMSYGPDNSGISLSNGAEVKIINSTVSDNKMDGIFLWQSAEAIVLNSEISNNGRNGISLWDLSEVKVSKSKIVDNGESGITFPSWSNYFDEELKGNM